MRGGCHNEESSSGPGTDFVGLAAGSWTASTQGIEARSQDRLALAVKARHPDSGTKGCPLVR